MSDAWKLVFRIWNLFFSDIYTQQLIFSSYLVGRNIFWTQSQCDDSCIVHGESCDVSVSFAFCTSIQTNAGCNLFRIVVFGTQPQLVTGKLLSPYRKHTLNYLKFQSRKYSQFHYTLTPTSLPISLYLIFVWFLVRKLGTFFASYQQ